MGKGEGGIEGFERVGLLLESAEEDPATPLTLGDSGATPWRY